MTPHRRTTSPESGGPKIISFSANNARGMMARFIRKEKLDRAESLRAFSEDGYRFEPKASSDDVLVFHRLQP
jgi:cytoplasmic iron level regulating protein YaaA (DUF328/UPF0246 family)